MKRVSVFSIICLLAATPLARCQEPPITPLPTYTAASPPVSAPTRTAMSSQEMEENFKALKAEVADLKEARDDYRKRFEEIRNQLRELREQNSKPNTAYATQEELKSLADAVKEVDRKRADDSKHIMELFENLGKSISAPPSAGRGTAKPPPDATPAPTVTRGDETGVTYTVKKGDYISTIAQAYRDQGIKVTTDQIEKANPTVDSSKLRVGQKLFIPVPKTTGGK